MYRTPMPSADGAIRSYREAAWSALANGAAIPNEIANANNAETANRAGVDLVVPQPAMTDTAARVPGAVSR
jgi:hypothetical protein